MRRTFTLDVARAALPHVQSVADEVIEVRAELVALQVRQQHGDDISLADLKGHEARLADLIDGLQRDGLEVKGWAPLLVDFPSVLDGHDVLLCWLEGEAELSWFHDPTHGFAGRRRLT